MSEPQPLSTLILWLEGHPGIVQFVFRGLARAASKLCVIEEYISNPITSIRIEDDFGRSIVVRVSKITAAQVTDCAAELNGQADLAILQAHANTKLQKRAQQDPMLSGRPMIVPAQPGGGVSGPLPFQR